MTTKLELVAKPVALTNRWTSEDRAEAVAWPVAAVAQVVTLRQVERWPALAAPSQALVGIQAVAQRQVTEALQVWVALVASVVALGKADRWVDPVVRCPSSLAPTA